jgi:hypothetical protein
MNAKSLSTTFPVVGALFAICILGRAQDSADVLARILADKGTISASELARVEAASPADRIRMLATLLQEKGVLSAGDVAKVTAPAASGAASQLAATAPKTEPQPTTAAQTAAPPATSKNHFPVTFYGTILLNAVEDTSQMNIGDIPLFAAKPDALGDDKSFAMTARQSRLGLLFSNPGEIAGANLSGQVEIDFLGGKAPFGNGVNMDLPRLRLAFGRMDWSNFSLEAGQDWAIFAPLNPTSLAEYAIPSLSAAGNPWIRMPQIRGEAHGRVGDGLTLLAQVAAIDPNMGDYSTATFSASRPPGSGERGRSPGGEARLALTDTYDDRNFTIGFSGHFAHGKNSGTVGDVTEQLSFNSWGGALDYSLPFSKKFNLTGELYIGQGLGIFSVDSGEALEAPGLPGSFGVRSRGGWIQAQYNFSPKWQVNLAYGIDDPNAHDIPVGLRTRNQSYMGNIMYNFTRHTTVAWEYRRILTDFRNQISSNVRGNTIDLAFAYMF